MLDWLKRRIMGFMLMLSFFTRLPLGAHIEYSEQRYRDGLWAFPLTGLIIGLILACVAYLIEGLPALSKLLIILTYLWMTGAIHLDGLSDSIDGLFSNRDKARTLEIMKDSNIGAFGAIALILYFLFFYEAIQMVNWRWLLMMPFVGKTMGTLVASYSVYARETEGMGTLFMNGVTVRMGIFYLCLAILMGWFFLDGYGALAVAVSFVVTAALAQKVKRVIDGQTGDTIGLMIEISQMVFLFVGGLIWV